MKIRRTRFVVRSLVVALALPLLPLVVSPLGCGSAAADEVASPGGEQELEPVTVTLFGGSVLLFMEHPPLVVGQDARFLAHFSVLATGEPVRSGRATLTVGPTTLVADAPKRDGLFIPEASFPGAGSFPARITVESGQATETLDLGEVVVHATDAAAREAAAAGEEEGAADEGVPFLMEQQWKIGLLLAEAGPARLVERLALPARVVLAEGAAAQVTAPIDGSLSGPDGGALPRTGDRVQAGQVLAVVEPPLTLERSLLAVTAERDLAEAHARLRFAEQDSERIERLRPAGLATQQQLDEAHRDLEVARGAVQAAEIARARLGVGGAAPEASGPAGGGAPEDGGTPDGEGGAPPAEGLARLVVRAPIAGELVGAGRVVGESVEAGQALFRVVDTRHLWVEGRLSEFDLARVGGAPRAVVTLPARPGTRLPVGEGEATRLLAIGPEVDERSRTTVIRYALEAPDGEVMPGMLASLEIALGSADAAVAIPAEAVVMDGGLPTVYVMAGGETFERRDVQLGLADGALVQVLSGVAPGEHVATHGAATVRMAALSPAAFGHGHAH